MPIPRSPSTFSRIKIGALGLVVSLLALLPWWRNHDHLRDFYDYGLFINVNARLAAGQRPFTDFTTPAQSGTFLLNYAAEQAGGGTYVGMTRGAAALIVLGGLALTLMLARRFPPWVAALLALAIIVGSASQHTIIFYNPLGVLALALTVWSFAVAPLLRRATLGWHLLAAAGLFLGGINKINFHLLACAMAVGWVLHAWAGQKTAGPRVLLTLGFILAFGFVLPVGTEIAWTGAGWQGWYYNVVALPLGARGGRISQLFSPQLYLTTLHNYYGQLRVPPIGLIGVLMPLLAVVAAWRGPAAAGRAGRAVFLVLAGLLAAFASSALLLTNNEIAYVTFAAALVLAIALWLGFGVPARGGWFAAGVLLPALILAVAGGESAWRGDRSQFGHDVEPRTEYWRGEKCGADFSYLRGLHLPSGLANSLIALAAWRDQLPGDEATRVFYGPGIEWLGHVWPVKNVPGLPLIPAAFDGRRENELLRREVISGDAFQYLVVVEAWDSWNPEVGDLLNRTTMTERLGTALLVYRKLKPGTVSSRPLDIISGGLGTNVDGTRMITPMSEHGLADGRRFLGLDRDDGRIDVETPCSRMSAEYVLMRTARGQGGPLTVHLAVHANMAGGLLPRWQATMTLPEGTDELVTRIDPVDASGLPLVFTVAIPPGAAGLVRAGWRGFQLTDTSDREVQPPMLQSGVEPLAQAWPEIRGALLPATLQDSSLFIRRARPGADALMLPAGGEAWVKLTGLNTGIRVSVRLRDPRPGDVPQCQLIYYKGGRIERFVPALDPAGGTARFDAWSPENGGWLGILVPPHPATPPVLVRIEAAARH